MRIPASIRNKNPGAQEPGPSSRKFGSTSYETLRWTYKGKPQINKCATFPSHQHGAAAMFDLLHRKYTGKTVEKAIATWCGSYYAAGYVKALEAGGVKAGDVLTKKLIEDPAFAVPLVQAMAKVEAGKDYPISDEDWHEAHAMAFGGAVAPEFSPDNDVPSPGPDARLAAEVKEKAKIGVPVAVTAAGGAVAVQPVPPVPVGSVPVPPDLTPVAAWKTWGSEIGTIVSWGWGNPYLVGGCVAAVLAIWFGPAILRRFA